MPTTGAEISSIAFRVASGRHPFFDVMLHRLDHHDGIVHNEADGQHEAKQRQRVDGEPEHRKDDERPDEETGTARSGIRVARQLCRKMCTTRITRTMAITNVSTISLIPSVTARVVSRAIV